MMRGVMNSECFVPREYAGARRRVVVTFSGEWAPGPGFFVWSVGMNVRPCIVYEGAFRSTVSGTGTEYVPAPGAFARSSAKPPNLNQPIIEYFKTSPTWLASV